MPPPRIPARPRTEGVPSFDPDAFFDKWSAGEVGAPQLTSTDFHSCIAAAFTLPPNDTYVYRATAEVTLAQAQAYLDFGGRNGLLDWYRDAAAPPPPADISAYTAVFAPSTATPKALTALAANAKKGSLRASVAAHLISLHRPPPPSISVPKAKRHVNPSLDLWAWSCHALRWAGPDPATAHIRISHALLPVLYHHFGCVVPSHDALVVIGALARGRDVVDLGSGNGYWTFMLRRAGVGVVPVDSGLSEWRTVWVGDTVLADGVRFLAQRDGGREEVLLLVYPQVGADFTGKVLRAYKGNTVVVAGTQNGNGFTGFKDETIDVWMAREMPRFEKVCQVPLPSFAGKDEALFAFVRKDTK